jgi:hypothetical protein
MCAGNSKTPKQQYEYYSEVLRIEQGKYELMPDRNKGMTNGLKKAAKIAGLEFELNRLEDKKHIDPLPASAKSYLKRLYGELKYGKSAVFKDKGNKYTTKGKLVQTESILFISEMDGVDYIENDERINNEFITGIPDCYLGETLLTAEYIPDVKNSWEWDTFCDNIDKPLNPLFWWQMQGYFALTTAKEGEISFCLMNMPESLLNDELMALSNRMQKQLNVIDVTISPEYRLAEAMLISNLTFDDMPDAERRLKFKVEKDDAAIAKIYERVPKCRDYLNEIQELHLQGVFTQKDLPELIESEDI